MNNSHRGSVAQAIPAEVPVLRSSPVDKTEVEATIRLLVPDGVTELRALDAIVLGDRWPGTYSGYFDDPSRLAEAAGTIEKAKGIYHVPNPIDRRLLARAANRLRRMGKGDSATGDADILSRRWLLVDADPVRPTGISSTDAEHNAAIEKIREIAAALGAEGWPAPIIADSGNGAHALYRVDLPTNDNGLVQRCLQAIADRFDDDVVTIDTTVHNPSRIWRLYGTRACKGDDTPERPHRMSRIIEVPDEDCRV